MSWIVLSSDEEGEEDESDDDLPDVVLSVTGGPLPVPTLSTQGRRKRKLVDVLVRL